VSGSAAPLETSLTSQAQEAVQAQVQTGEQLVHPVQCSPQVTANPAVGEEATQVTVQVSVTCTAATYNAHGVQSRVNALLGREATTRLGSAYALQGQITSTVNAVTVLDGRRGVVRLHVQVEGVWAYQLSATQLPYRDVPGYVNCHAFEYGNRSNADFGFCLAGDTLIYSTHQVHGKSDGVTKRRLDDLYTMTQTPHGRSRLKLLRLP
jgi:hypothetical protein